MAPSRSRSSHPSSSSSASSSSISKDTTDPSHSSRTIGYAVGFGVGIPILLTICILIWVTIRHRRKQREEDEVDKDIDFNGDVSFWSPRMPDQDAHYGGFGGDNPGVHRRDTMTTTHTGTNVDTESLANLSEMDSHSHKDFANASLSHLYTPELGFTPQGSQENFSRAINSVYGPSPAYPSTYKLQTPSLHGSMNGRFGHHSSSSFSSGTQGVGPFATPPRNAGTPSTVSQVYPPAPSFGNSTHPYADHFRRNSDGSIASRRHSSFDDLEATKQGGRVTTTSVTDPSSGSNSLESEADPSPATAQGSQLKGLRESPHPYSNLVGTLSTQSMHTASTQLMEPANHNGAEYDNEEDIVDPSSPLRGEPKNPTRHIYHQQARDRTSTFAFQQ